MTKRWLGSIERHGPSDEENYDDQSDDMCRATLYGAWTFSPTGPLRATGLSVVFEYDNLSGFRMVEIFMRQNIFRRVLSARVIAELPCAPLGTIVSTKPTFMNFATHQKTMMLASRHDAEHLARYRTVIA